MATKKRVTKKAKPSGGNSRPSRQKQTKRNQRSTPLAGRHCSKCGSTSNLMRHESPANSSHFTILCSRCHGGTNNYGRKGAR